MTDTSAKIHLLIAEAQGRMRRSTDPAHDLSHAERVARFAAQLADDTGLSEQQKTALVLAAWWHDVARTITKNPSFVWMPFVDDTISALMLWWATIRSGLLGSVAGMATRIIFCKGRGTGQILTRIIIRKRNRIMIDIIKDADNLELLNYERITQLWPLVEKFRRYHWGYRAMIRWFLSTNYLHMKTQAARAYVIKLLQSFLNWAREEIIHLWHVAQFGEKWCARMFRRAERLLSTIERLYLAGAQ